MGELGGTGPSSIDEKATWIQATGELDPPSSFEGEVIN